MKKIFYFGLFYAIFILNSCSEEFQTTTTSFTNAYEGKLLNRKIETDSIILDNPYEISNMKASLDRLKTLNPNMAYELKNFIIETSHLYIKFNPKTAEEEALLKSDSTLYLFDYRLDCEYNEEFLKNRESSSNDSIPIYYTSIKKDRQLPNINFEIISELYIPEQDTFFNDILDIDKYLITYQINNKTDLFNHLLFEAFVKTGNQDEMLEPESTAENRWIFGRKWKPKGTIRIWDNCGADALRTSMSISEYGNFIPLEGAKILMRQWFTVDSGITNSNGYFETGTVRGHARYIIQWERYQYSIRTGNFGQAELRGPNLKKEDWNKDINNGEELFHGHIHRAAHHYYYKNIKNLRRPPQNGFWKPQMKIGAFFESDPNINGDYRCWARFMGILPSIRIYNPNNTSCNIYGTTIHELAHASHSNMGGRDYRNTERKVKESWARGVQWDITNMIYNNSYYVYYNLPNYTLVVKDMIDSDNYTTGYDQVNGYTIKEIEDALQGKRNWNAWRDNIKNLYENETENNLDALFSYWNQ